MTQDVSHTGSVEPQLETPESGRGGAGSRTLVVITTAIGLAGIVAAFLTVVAAAVLADTYRPHADGVEEWLLPAEVQRAEDWADVHVAAVVALVATSLIASVLLVTTRLKLASARTSHVVLAIGAFTLAVIAWYTTALVRWEQLALYAVTVGSDIDGYWAAAFGDGVRFVLVDNDEVGQTSYATALCAHLAAPALAGVALGWLCWSAMRTARRAVATN